MTVVHTYFYIVVDTQRGCHTLELWKLFNPTEFHVFELQTYITPPKKLA